MKCKIIICGRKMKTISLNDAPVYHRISSRTSLQGYFLVTDKHLRNTRSLVLSDWTNVIRIETSNPFFTPEIDSPTLTLRTTSAQIHLIFQSITSIIARYFPSTGSDMGNALSGTAPYSTVFVLHHCLDNIVRQALLHRKHFIFARFRIVTQQSLLHSQPDFMIFRLRNTISTYSYPFSERQSQKSLLTRIITTYATVVTCPYSSSRIAAKRGNPKVHQLFTTR